MAAMTEAAQVGKRQEILDQIFNIQSDKTPFLSLLSAGKRPEAMLATWVAEVFPDVASTGVLEGTAVSSYERVDRYLLQGASQLFRRPWAVGRIASSTNAAGVNRDEKGRQRMLAMLLVKRMIEQQFCSTDDSTVESSPTPWTTRGAFTWLQNSAQTNHEVPSALRPAAAVSYTGAVASYTEASLRAQLLAAYAAKKEMLKLTFLVGADLRAVIDDFTNVYPVASSTSQPRTTYHVARNNTVENMVDRIRTSFGDLSVVTSTFLAVTTSTGAVSAYTSKSGLGLDFSQWDVGYIDKPANTDLPPDGSGDRGYVDTIALLRCKNPLGQIRNLSNSCPAAGRP